MNLVIPEVQKVGDPCVRKVDCLRGIAHPTKKVTHRLDSKGFPQLSTL